MTSLPDIYAKALLDLQVPAQDLEETRQLLSQPELREALCDPFVSKTEKQHVIDKLFPDSAKAYVTVMSDNQDIGRAAEIFEAYDALCRARDNTCRAVFTYVTKPNDEQIEKLKKVICRKYGKSGVQLALKEDPSLIGGFILQVDDSVLDKSLKAAMLRMQRHFAAR